MRDCSRTSRQQTRILYAPSPGGEHQLLPTGAPAGGIYYIWGGNEARTTRERAECHQRIAKYQEKTVN